MKSLLKRWLGLTMAVLMVLTMAYVPGYAQSPEDELTYEEAYGFETAESTDAEKLVAAAAQLNDTIAIQK